jgi:hypothetical protein
LGEGRIGRRDANAARTVLALGGQEVIDRSGLDAEVLVAGLRAQIVSVRQVCATLLRGIPNQGLNRPRGFTLHWLARDHVNATTPGPCVVVLPDDLEANGSWAALEVGEAGIGLGNAKQTS